MTDSRDTAELLAAIDEDPDELHLDHTPAVLELSRRGWAVAPGLLDLMSTADDMTRLRAARALELIASRAHGFVEGQGFPDEWAEAEVRELWLRNGDYTFDAPESERAESVRRWRDWLDQRASEEGTP